MIRVLLTTFPGAFLHHGGGERELLLLREALLSSGVMADIYGPDSKSVSVYDAAIHFSMAGGSEHIVRAIHDEGLKLILWPNLWFVDPPDAEHLRRLTDFLGMFHAVVFRTQAEESHFRNYFDLTGKAVIRSAWLVSPKFMRQDVSNVFRESYGLGDYAIWPGIIEPQKNQLTAIRAFKGVDAELVISGRVRDERYVRQCREEAGPNVRFIPSMAFGSELHLSALRFSRLFIELPFDFPGASAVEARAAGCSMLLSRSDWTEEVLGGYCEQVDPADVGAVRDAVNRLMISGGNSDAEGAAVFDMNVAIEDLCRYVKSGE